MVHDLLPVADFGSLDSLLTPAEWRTASCWLKMEFILKVEGCIACTGVARLANRRTGRGGGCPSSWTAGTGSSAAFRA